MESVVRNGGDVDVRGPGGFTALHAAVSQGHRRLVDLLLEHRADGDAVSNPPKSSKILAIFGSTLERNEGG